MTTATTTTNHDTIRRWAEARDGHPARVQGTGKGGILRIDFNEPEDGLERIDWNEFFRIFDESNLTFLYQEEGDNGSTSRFNKLIDRDRSG